MSQVTQKKMKQRKIQHRFCPSTIKAIIKLTIEIGCEVKATTNMVWTEIGSYIQTEKMVCHSTEISTTIVTTHHTITHIVETSIINTETGITTIGQDLTLIKITHKIQTTKIAPLLISISKVINSDKTEVMLNKIYLQNKLKK